MWFVSCFFQTALSIFFQEAVPNGGAPQHHLNHVSRKNLVCMYVCSVWTRVLKRKVLWLFIVVSEAFENGSECVCVCARAWEWVLIWVSSAKWDDTFFFFFFSFLPPSLTPRHAADVTVLFRHIVDDEVTKLLPLYVTVVVVIVVSLVIV